MDDISKSIFSLGVFAWETTLSQSFGKEERAMFFDLEKHQFVGNKGTLPVAKEDIVMRKLAMILEGECLDIGPLKSAEKFGYSKQRYYQILDAFQKIGSDALVDKKRGPKAKRRRTSELQRQVIRYRFLDPQASPAVIAQKLRQTGFTISVRSVERVIQEYGIQKNSTGAAQETARTFLSINFMPKREKSWTSILTACRAIASDTFGCIAKNGARRR